jgi:thiamine-monophosphate kinase
VIDLETLPLAGVQADGTSPEAAERLVLHGGDDYELLFTVPPAAVARVASIATATRCPLHRIGTVTAGAEVACRRDGRPVTDAGKGHDHFA